MDRRWVFLSVLMHAALLFGMGLSTRPGVRPAPAGLVVSLVSSPPGNPGHRHAPAPTPSSHPVETPLKFPPGQRSEPPAGRMRTARQNPPEKGRPVVTMTESMPAEPKDEAGIIREAERPSGGQTVSTETAENSPAGEPMENPIEPNLLLSASGMPSQPQTSDFGLQTRFLAFAGNPHSLGGIVGGGPGTGFIQAGILSLPEPAYPVLSRRRGEEGRVIIEVKVSAEGGVLGARIMKSSSYERLDRSALRAIENATFRPALENGKPVESERKVAYTFRLEER